MINKQDFLLEGTLNQIIMDINKKTFLIGEKVTIANESEIGVVTRIDFENNTIYVLFPKMKEKSYPYPDALTKNIINLL